MATSFRLEYVILIILCLAYYFYVVKEDRNKSSNTKFIKSNLKEGSKIITKSGLIGQVIKIDKNEVLIVSGKENKFSYLNITIDSIEKIIEA